MWETANVKTSGFLIRPLASPWVDLNSNGISMDQIAANGPRGRHPQFPELAISPVSIGVDTNVDTVHGSHIAWVASAQGRSIPAWPSNVYWSPNLQRAKMPEIDCYWIASWGCQRTQEEIGGRGQG